MVGSKHFTVFHIFIPHCYLLLQENTLSSFYWRIRETEKEIQTCPGSHRKFVAKHFVAAQELQCHSQHVSPDPSHLILTSGKWINHPKQVVIKLVLTDSNENLFITLAFVSFLLTVSFDLISYGHDLFCVNLGYNLAMEYSKANWMSMINAISLI